MITEDIQAAGRPGDLAGESLHPMALIMLYCASAAIIFLVLAAGGRSAFAVHAFEAAVLALVCLPAAAALFGFQKTVEGFELRGTARVLGVLGAGILALGLVQLVPFPIASLRVISPHTASRYEVLNQDRAPLTLDSYLTTESLWFFAACFGLWLILAGIPRARMLRYGASSEKLQRLQGYMGRACTGDYAASFLQKVLMRIGVVAAVLAIIHWGLRAEIYMGLIDPGVAADPSRAHWPLVNPNHLAALLEICSMTALTVVLRDAHVLSLLKHQARAEGVRGMSRLGSFAQLRAMAALFTMWVAVLLTLSRTGATLTFLGALTLFLYSTWNLPRRDERSGTTSVRRMRRIAERAVLCAAIVIGLLFFLGDTGRDLLAGRVEYAINERLDYYRLELSRASVEIFRLYPIFGVGFGCWHLAAAQSVSQELGGWTLDYAHNDPLQWTAEAGIIGCVLAVLAGSALARALRRSLKAGATLPVERLEIFGAFAALLLPIIHSFVDFPFRIPAVAAIWCVALCVFVRLLSKVIVETHR